MSIKAPIKSVGNATLVAPGTGIRETTVKIYKRTDPIKGCGIQSHIYHVEDHGRLRQTSVCEYCGEKLTSENSIKLIEQNGEFFDIDHDEVWGFTGEMNVISYYSESSLSRALIDGTMYVMEIFEVSPTDFISEANLNAFLRGLEITHHVANLNVPLRGQMRRGVLLADGTLYTLFFQNEIRPNREPISAGNRVHLMSDPDKIVNAIRKNSKMPVKVRPRVTPERAASFLRPVR